MEFEEEFEVGRGARRSYNAMLSAADGPHAWAFKLVGGDGGSRPAPVETSPGVLPQCTSANWLSGRACVDTPQRGYFNSSSRLRRLLRRAAMAQAREVAGRTLSTLPRASRPRPTRGRPPRSVSPKRATGVFKAVKGVPDRTRLRLDLCGGPSLAGRRRVATRSENEGD